MNSTNERKILIAGTSRHTGMYVDRLVRAMGLKIFHAEFYNFDEIRPKGKSLEICFRAYDEYELPTLSEEYSLVELIKQVEKLAIKNPRRTEYKLQLINLRKKLKCLNTA